MYKDLSLKEKAKVLLYGSRLGLTSVEDIAKLYDDAISHKFAEGSVANSDWDPINKIKQKYIQKKVLSAIDLFGIEEVRQRAYNNIDPWGIYLNARNEFNRGIIKNQKPNYPMSYEKPDEWRLRKGREKISDAIFAQYLQIPIQQRHFDYLLEQSSYKPTIGGSENDIYYSLPLDDETKQLLIDERFAPIYEYNTTALDKDNRGERKIGNKNIKIGQNTISTILGGYNLGTHTIGRGYDKNKGEYVSYYDLWDLNPIKIEGGEDLSQGIGAPVKIYDRIYLDDYYGIGDKGGHATWLPEVTITPNEYKRGGHIAAIGMNMSPDWDPNNPYHYHTVSGEKIVITPEDWEKHKGLPYFKLVEDAVLAELAAHPGPEYVINPQFSEDLRRVYKGNIGTLYQNYSSFSGNLPQGYSFTPEGLVLDNQGNLYVLKGFRQSPRFTYDESNPLTFPVLEGRNQGNVTFYPVNMERTIKPSLPVSSIMNVDKEHESAIKKAQNQYEYPVTLWDILPTGEGVISTYDNVYSTTPSYGDDYSKNYQPYKDKGAKQFFENYISNIIGREIKLNGPSYMWDDNGNFRNVYADDVFNLSQKEFNLVKKKLKEAKNRDYEFEKKKTEENLNKFKQEGILMGDDEDVYRNSIKYYEDWISQDNPWLWGDEDRSPKPRKISRKEAEKKAVIEVGPLQVNGVLAYSKGGPIVTPYGQWKYPGRDTIIPSNNITMNNVNYPVLGISDTGDTKIMMPWNDYKFRGSMVYEHPLVGNLALEGKKFNKKWRALDNILYNVYPDTTFTREKTGVGDIEVFDRKNGDTIIYPNGYRYINPYPDLNTIVYNPNTNDALDIRLDALHLMPLDATYDALNTLYRNNALGSDVYYIANKRYEEDKRRYGKDNIDSFSQYYNNEADALLRNMFIEGTPEYIKAKRYYPNKQQLREWNIDLLPYINEIQEYLETGVRPKYILPEVTVTPDEYKKGGSIHIKPENRGKFTALKKRTGHSASWFKAHGTPALRKMATFALNARHWNHKHDNGGPTEDIKDINNRVSNWMRNWYLNRPTQLMNNFDDYEFYDRDLRYPSGRLVDIYNKMEKGLSQVENTPVSYAPITSYGMFTTETVNPTIYLQYGLDDSAFLHEKSHALNEYIGGPEGKDMWSSPFINAIGKVTEEDLKKGEVYDDYLDNLGEIYSRLNQVRYQNNLDPKHIYTLDEIKKMRNEGNFHLKQTDGLERYSDKFILHLLNDVAYNNTNELSNKALNGGHLFLEKGQIFKRPQDDLTGRNILTSPILPPKSYYEQFTIPELEPKKPQPLQPLEGTYGNKYSELVPMSDNTYINNPINKGLQLDWRTRALEFAPFLAIGAGPAIGSTATWLATSKPALYNLGRMTLGSEIGGRGVDLASNLFTGNTWGLNVGNAVEGITGWNPNNTMVGLFVTDLTNPGYSIGLGKNIKLKKEIDPNRLFSYSEAEYIKPEDFPQVNIFKNQKPKLDVEKYLQKHKQRIVNKYGEDAYNKIKLYTYNKDEKSIKKAIRDAIWDDTHNLIYALDNNFINLKYKELAKLPAFNIGRQAIVVNPELTKKIYPSVFELYGDDAALGLIKSHELDHAINWYRQMHPDQKATNGLFDLTKILKDSTKNYFEKQNNTELSARGSLIKDYFDSDIISGDLLRFAARNYVKDTGIDNDMTAFFNGIKDWDGMAKWITKNSSIIATPFLIGNIINKYDKDLKDNQTHY